MKFLLFLSFFPGFLVALTVHEAAHALVSKWLGDRYAEKQGRISLNPMRHLSALGTLMLFIAGFGWGKPVPVNLYNYKHPKLYYLLSSLAGPLSNILLSLISLGLIYGLNFVCQTESGQTNLSQAGYIAYSLAWMFLYSLLYINVILAVINLIPIPPLDGSKIWPCLIPRMRPVFSGKATWLWIVILIVMMRGDALSKVISPVMHRVEGLMPDMLNRAQSFPSDFPEEVRPPKEATDSHYLKEIRTKKGPVKGEQYYLHNKSTRSIGDPNVFTTSFWLLQSYPAKAHREQLSKKLSNLKWVQENTEKDPNQWDLKEFKDKEGLKNTNMVYTEKWKKENAEMKILLYYDTDPNGHNIGSEAYITYIYTILDPNTP